ncbi:recombinase family protein [Serratia marcescens]|uniref:recombinase family protein n=1 Tax=Serratia marcescens TaxID=615 RepID=UPI003D6FD84C
MRAFLYCRVSSTHQTKKQGGTGITRQEATVIEYINDYQPDPKLGYQLSLDDHEMLDPDLGKSAYHGYNFTKGALGEFKRKVLSREIKEGALVIENVDRFSRLPEHEAIREFNDLILGGIDIHEVETGVVYSKKIPNTLSKLSHSIERAWGESERKSTIAKKVWKARRETVLATGKPLPARTPKWLKIVNSEYVIDKKYSDAVNTIFKLYTEGYGTAYIVKYLNNNDMKIDGLSWSTAALTKMYSDERLIGWKSGMKIYPAIVGEDVFKKAREIKNSKVMLNKQKVNSSQRSIFNSVARCGKCGAAMCVSVNGHNKLYYWCWKKRGTKECDLSGFVYAYAELAILQHIKNIDWNKVYRDSDRSNERSEDLNMELAELLNYKLEIDEIIKTTERPPTAVLRALITTEEKISKLEEEISSIKASEYPLDFDFNVNDITNQNNIELRQKCNIQIKKSIKSISFNKDDKVIIIDIKYFTDVLKHVLILDNKTGGVVSSISIIKEGDAINYSSGSFKIIEHEDGCTFEGIDDVSVTDYFMLANYIGSIREKQWIVDVMYLQHNMDAVLK